MTLQVLDVFPCDFWEIFKSSCYIEQLWATACEEPYLLFFYVQETVRKFVFDIS